MSHLVLRVIKDPTLVASTRLKEAGFGVYCPMVLEQRINRHHKHGGVFLRNVPMFPGYLFLEKPKPFRRVFAPGVHVMPLTLDGRYLLLNDHHIEQVRQHEARLALPAASPITEPAPPTVGDVVTLLRGVLARSKAVVVSVRNSRQVLVRLLASDNTQVFVNLADVR